MGLIAAEFNTVGDSVAVKAIKNHKVQQLSTNGMQQVQYQSIGNNRIPQGSIRIGIWFGTRGSEVQILSPRPICLQLLATCWTSLNLTTWF